MRSALIVLFVPNRRPLPVLVLADTSTSMEGKKISALNAAIAEMQQKFLELHDARGHILHAIAGLSQWQFFTCWF